MAFVDDVIIPTSWYNIDESNKYLYIRRFQDLSDTRTDRIVQIEVSNHTPDSLIDAVQDALNTAFGSSVLVCRTTQENLNYLSQQNHKAN